VWILFVLFGLPAAQGTSHFDVGGLELFSTAGSPRKAAGSRCIPNAPDMSNLVFCEQSHGIWKGKTGLPPDTLLPSVPLRTRLHELLTHALPVQVLQSKLRHDAGERALLPECNGAFMYEYDCRVTRDKTHDA
jgi:hypothetical protein